MNPDPSLSPPIGWTLRDTRTRRVVLETSAGWLIDRGFLAIDSVYRVDHTGATVDLEHGISWVDPRLGLRLWINRGEDAILPGLDADRLTIHTPRGVEIWHVGDGAAAVIDRRLAEWTGAVAS